MNSVCSLWRQPARARPVHEEAESDLQAFEGFAVVSAFFGLFSGPCSRPKLVLHGSLGLEYENLEASS